MARRLVVEIIGDASSLERAAAESAAALQEVRLGSGNAAESRIAASQIIEGVRGISDATRTAVRELDDVKLTATVAAESAVAGDAIQKNLHGIGVTATITAAKIAAIGTALGIVGFGFGGGGRRIGGGLFGGGFFLPGAKLGSLAMFAGFGAEHLLTTMLGVGGSGIQALLGAGFLGLGALGTTAVGMGTDMAGIGQAANDIRTITPLVASLNTAIKEYGKNSAQAAAAEQALNQGLDGFSSKARAAVLVAAQTANQFHAMFNAATGAAESVGAKIITEAMKVGEAFLPTIGRFALQNMDIIKRDIQPLFDWLKNGAFSGPGRGGGLGIFTNLEQIFQKNLPTSIHAMSQGFELFMKVVDVAAQHLGGFMAKLNEILTRLNGPEFGKVASFVNSSIQAFHVWMGMFVNLGKAIYEAFKPALGVGRMVVQGLSDAFAGLAKYLGAKGTQDVLHGLFDAHKQQLKEIGQALAAFAPVIKGMLSAFMQIEAVVTRLVTGPIRLFALVIREVLDLPFVSKIAGWVLGIGFFVVALDKAIIAFKGLKVVGLATAVWEGIVTAATATYSAAVAIATGATAAFGVAMDIATGPIGLVIFAVAALGAAAYEIYTHWGAVSSFLNGVWNDIKSLFDAGIRFVTTHWRDFAVGLATVIAGPLGGLVAYVATHWAQIKTDAVTVWNAIVSFVSTVWHDIENAVSGGLNLVTGSVSKGLNTVLGFFRRLPGEIVSALGDIGHLLYDAGKQLVQGLLDGMNSMLGAISHASSGLVSVVKNVFENLWHSPPDAYGRWIGGLLTQGIVAGLHGGTPAVVSAAGTLVSAAKSSMATTGAMNGSFGAAGTSGGNLTIQVTVPSGFVGSEQQLADALGRVFVLAGRRGHPYFRAVNAAAGV